MPLNRAQFKQYSRQNLAADGFVEFNSFGQKKSGRILQVYTSGKITPPGVRAHSGYTATQNAPVLEIELYEKKADSTWQTTGERIIRPALDCQSVADLRRAASYTGCTIIQKDNGPDELIIYSDIGSMFDWFTGEESGTTANDVRELLKKIGQGKPLSMRINSPGGDAFEGMAIYNVLSQWAITNKSVITGYNDGLTASAATVVMMAASKIIAGQQSMFMIHRGWSRAIGNRNDFEKAIEMLDRIDNQTIDLYNARQNAAGVATSRDKTLEMVDAETYMDAAEQVKFGFADEIFETRGKVAAYGPLRPWMHKTPESLKQKFSEATTSRVSESLSRVRAEVVSS